MSRLKEWFEEVCPNKVFTSKTCNFVIQKGFKITHYYDDDSYSILDTRFNDFYNSVSKHDMDLFKAYGFVKGTNMIMYGRNLIRVESYMNNIEELYVKKAKYQKLLPKSEQFYTKRIKNCSENIHRLHDMMQFYQAQVEQFESKHITHLF